MPKSRSNTKVKYCPGCGLACHKGNPSISKRLERHMRNQCGSKKVRAGTHK